MVASSGISLDDHFLSLLEARRRFDTIIRRRLLLDVLVSFVSNEMPNEMNDGALFVNYLN